MPKEKETTTELMNIDEPSKAIKLYKITPAEIAAKLKDYDHLKVIEGDTESYKEVRAALTILVHTRTGIDAHRKQLGDKLRKSLGHINKAGGMLIEPMTPYETRFNSELKAEDARKLAIEEEKERKEQAHKDDIRTKITQIALMQSGLQTMGLIELRGLSDRLENMEVRDGFHEFTDEAEKVLDASYDAVQAAIATRIKLDKEAEERKAEAERLEKVRKEQEAKDKELKKKEKKLADEKQEADEKRLTFRLKQLKQAIYNGLEAFDQSTRKVIISHEDLINLSDPDFDKIVDTHNKMIDEREQTAAKKAEDERQEKDRAEEAEEERVEALKPDRQKLINFANDLVEIEIPKVKSAKAIKLLVEAQGRLNELAADIKERAGKL